MADAPPGEERNLVLADEPAGGIRRVSSVGVLRQPSSERPMCACSVARSSGSTGSETRARAGSASAKARKRSELASSVTRLCSGVCDGSIRSAGIAPRGVIVPSPR